MMVFGAGVLVLGCPSIQPHGEQQLCLTLQLALEQGSLRSEFEFLLYQTGLQGTHVVEENVFLEGKTL